jgi:hypothetical protein
MGTWMSPEGPSDEDVRRFRKRAEDLAEIVDEFADEIDPPRIIQEADRLEIDAEELIDLVAAALKERLG